MKLLHIIIIAIVVIAAIFILHKYVFKNNEAMTDLPEEINQLLDQANNETYYSEEISNSSSESEDLQTKAEELIKRVIDAEIKNIRPISMEEQVLVQSETSIDTKSLPEDSLTSITVQPESRTRVVAEAETRPVMMESRVVAEAETRPVMMESRVVAEAETRPVAETVLPKPVGAMEEVYQKVGSAECTVGTTTDNAEQYIEKLILEGQKYCSKFKQDNDNVIRNYRNDFFNFRDKVWDNSRRNDVAYKVARLQLEGNTKLSERIQGRKISDIYDDLTNQQTIYDKSCILKEPSDNAGSHQGYYNTTGNREEHLTRDNWVFMNDVKPKNKILDGVSAPYGFDSTDVNYSEL